MTFLRASKASSSTSMLEAAPYSRFDSFVLHAMWGRKSQPLATKKKRIDPDRCLLAGFGSFTGNNLVIVCCLYPVVDKFFHVEIVGQAV